MTDAFHEGHQGRQPRTEQPCFEHRLRQAAVVELLAARAPVGQALMLRDDGRRCGDFHLLQDLGGTIGKLKQTTALGAAIQRVRLETIDGPARKRRSQVLLMSWLSASSALLAVLARRLGRLDHIARRWFGRSRGVLARRGQLLFQLGHPGKCLRQCGFQCRNLGVLLAKTLGKTFTTLAMARFPQLHRAERYGCRAFKTRSTPRTADRILGKFLGGA